MVIMRSTCYKINGVFRDPNVCVFRLEIDIKVLFIHEST